MKKLHLALPAAGLVLLAACSVHEPRLDHPDPSPIVIAAPITPAAEAGAVRAALAERRWQTVEDAPGHVVASLTRKPFNLSMKLDIAYGSGEIRMKLLELASLDGEPLAQNQLNDYLRWTGALRQSIVRALDKAVLLNPHTAS